MAFLPPTTTTVTRPLAAKAVRVCNRRVHVSFYADNRRAAQTMVARNEAELQVDDGSLSQCPSYTVSIPTTVVPYLNETTDNKEFVLVDGAGI